MAEVTIDMAAGDEIMSAITRGSVDRLGLSDGDEVTVVIKVNEVMLAKWAGTPFASTRARSSAGAGSSR